MRNNTQSEEHRMKSIFGGGVLFNEVRDMTANHRPEGSEGMSRAST